MQVYHPSSSSPFPLFNAYDGNSSVDDLILLRNQNGYLTFYDGQHGHSVRIMLSAHPDLLWRKTVHSLLQFLFLDYLEFFLSDGYDFNQNKECIVKVFKNIIPPNIS